MFLNVSLENFVETWIKRDTRFREYNDFFFQISFRRDIDRFIKNGKMAAARLGDRMPRNLVNWRLQGALHISRKVSK